MMVIMIIMMVLLRRRRVCGGFGPREETETEELLDESRIEISYMICEILDMTEIYNINSPYTDIINNN